MRAPDARKRCVLLLQLGQAQLTAGSVEAGRESCRAAAELARSLGETELMVQAALTYGSVFLYGQVDRTLVALLEEALAALDERETGLRKPRWLGYLIQRPESHCIHHERGVHKYNYSDLPLWDMVFGTFKNSATFDREAGFYDGASSRIADMLIGRDVTSPAHTTGPAPEQETEPRAA